MSRRFFWLAVAIVTVIAAYTAGWFWLAGRLEGEARAAIAAMGRGGDRAACDNLEARGYPFRIGVFCDAAFVERRAAGVSLSTGAVRSAAQVYNPFHIVAEADAPARLTLPLLPPVDLRWEGLQASARLARPLPERISIEARALAASIDGAAAGAERLLTAQDAQLHMRPAGADLDLAARFTQLAPGPGLIGTDALPGLDGLIDLSLKDGVARLASGAPDLRGAAVTVRRVEIGTGAARLTATGTASVGEDGLVDADLSLSASDPAEIARLLALAFPETAGQIATAFLGLSVLGPSATLPLTVRDGAVFLSVLPLGQLPPL